MRVSPFHPPCGSPDVKLRSPDLMALLSPFLTWNSSLWDSAVHILSGCSGLSMVEHAVILRRDRVFISLRPAWTTEWIFPLQLNLSGSTLKDSAKVCLLCDSKSGRVDRKH